MQISSIGMPDNFVTMSQETIETTTQTGGLFADGEGIIDDIYTQQEFMNSIATNISSQKMSDESFLAFQMAMEQFSLETKIVSKTVSVAIQGVQTLVQLQ